MTVGWVLQRLRKPYRLSVSCSILVANNGIGAVKFIRSVRSWAYKTFGSERAVSLVAMATPEVLRPQARLFACDDIDLQASGMCA